MKQEETGRNRKKPKKMVEKNTVNWKKLDDTEKKGRNRKAQEETGRNRKK